VQCTCARVCLSRRRACVHARTAPTRASGGAMGQCELHTCPRASRMCEGPYQGRGAIATRRVHCAHMPALWRALLRLCTKGTEPQGGAHWAALVMRADPPAPPLSEGAKKQAKMGLWPGLCSCMRACAFQGGVHAHSRTRALAHIAQSRTRALAHSRAHSCTRALAHSRTRASRLAHSRIATHDTRARGPHRRRRCRMGGATGRFASRADPSAPRRCEGAIGPSHMGRLPGSCLACARLACKAAYMRTLALAHLRPSCTCTSRIAHYECHAPTHM
jgi:hypothetical protein